MILRGRSVALLAFACLTVSACSADTRDDSVTSTRTAQPPPTTVATPTVTAGGCPSTELAPVFCASTRAMQAASVVHIVDGDTFDVTLDGEEERVRIFGVDTPERGEPCFSEATSLLRALAGDEVYLQTDVRKVDRNGRLLRYVYREDGLSIDAALIAAGVAHAWTDDGALRDELVALEEAAREARVGCLWA